MNIFVSADAQPGGRGSVHMPFQTIQEAANVAMPGDIVVVGPGVYREWVDPVTGGTEDAPITFHAQEAGQAVITGAEPLPKWTHVAGNIWTARVSNEIFQDRNPYTTLVSGDWYIKDKVAHLGDVFLNGKSMYEVTGPEGVYHPVQSMASWDPDFSVYTWYCNQDTRKNETVFLANFQGLDPNQEKVEYSVRPACFYPKREGVNYITLSGFTICMAATQWAPPTAYQEGMVGPHWSKGWVIEDCEIYESKCCGISLGKYLQPNNDNKWLRWKYKDGTQTERECICQAQREGWTKEAIGGHTIRRCNIHHCGQTGIVGHLGGVFSTIEDNHIHHINNKQNLAGAEIGGIKMHAAIDVTIRKNHIHHCTRGLWLDWQAQGTRVTGNLFHDNTLPNLKDVTEVPQEALVGMGEDIFVEVSHGPTLIDNNVLLSARALKLCSQGVAVIHNLIGGSLAAVGTGTNNGAKTLSSPRYTPYHVPHRTEIAGFMTFLHGDVRFFNNIFVQQPVHPFFQPSLDHPPVPNDWDDGNFRVGTCPYNGYPTFREWDREFDGYCGMGSPASDRYYMHLPVWCKGNVYANGAKPWDKEMEYTVMADAVYLELVEKEDGCFLETDLYDLLEDLPETDALNTERLGMAFEPEQKFENPDGTPIDFNLDYNGTTRSLLHPMPGPFETASSSIQSLVGKGWQYKNCASRRLDGDEEA